MQYIRTLTIAALMVLLMSAFYVMADRIVTINKFENTFMTGLPTSGDYNAIGVGDIDGDGDDDIAFGGEDYGSMNTVGLNVYAGNGAGTWTSVSGLPTTDSWGGCAFGDADGDGNIELYAGDEGWGTTSGAINGVGAWEYSSGSWSTTGITSPESANTVDNLRLENITGDASLDLLIGYSRSGKGIKVYEGSGSSPISWTDFSSGLPTSGEFSGIDDLDMNNDGLIDIVGSCYSSGGVKFYTQGATTWTEYTSSLPNNYKSGSTTGLELGDIDNDGNGDIVYAPQNGGLRVALGNGGGSDGKTFSWTDVTSNLPMNLKSGAIYQITLGDIDGDGDLDLLSPIDGSGLRLYLGNGTVASGSSFRFTEVTGKGLPTSGSYIGSALLDFDKDGVLDIAGSTWGTGVKVYRSNFTILDTANTPPLPLITGGGTILVGKAMDLAGNKSTDAEDCPNGDVLGNELTYDWNLTKKPAGSALTDTAFKKQGPYNAFVNFTADREGAYDVTLAVKDSFGKWSNKGLEAKITILATNQAPIPEAGENMTGLTGAEIMLDGSGSSDPDGHSFVCDWNLTVKPVGSAITDASLGPSDAVKKPAFTPDIVGTYEFTLAVRDTFGKWSAAEDAVTATIAKPNERPVADAGKDVSVHAGDIVVLNGSGSGDPDGTVVEYAWTCASSGIVLENETTALPSFNASKLGTHAFTLIVKDDNGTLSDPDEVRVTVVPQGANLPPNAHAGDDSEYQQGETVHLDGSGSYDMDGTIASFEWTSPAEIILNGSDTKTPWFVADVPGVWNFSLRVKDNGNTWSEPDTVKITIIAVHVNLPPVADAGEDQIVDEDESVILNGTGSSDPDGTITLYAWDCTSHELTLGTGASISVLLAEPGSYTFSLLVTDNEGAVSTADLVNVTVRDVIIPPPPIQNVTPTIGPFVTDLGNIVTGATVKLTAGSLVITGITDSAGKVKFSQGIPPGNYTMNVTKDGIGLMPDILIWVKVDGSVQYPGGSVPIIVEKKELEPKNQEEKSFLETWGIVLLIVVVVMVLVIISVIVFLAVRASGDEPEEAQTDEKICPECGKVMAMREDFGTYYCDECGGSEE